MECEDVVSLSGLRTIRRYEELTKIDEISLRNYATKT